MLAQPELYIYSVNTVGTRAVNSQHAQLQSHLAWMVMFASKAVSALPLLCKVADM